MKVIKIQKLEKPGSKLNFWQSAVNLLDAATGSSDHAYSVPGLSTVGPDGIPRSRRVVLRSVDTEQGILKIYTDRRSVKARHLDSGSEFSFLFWDPESSIQLACGGPTHWAPVGETEAVFTNLPKHGRKAYATLPRPGSELDAASSGLPADWDDMDLSATDYALDNFGIAVTTLRWADVLHLDRNGNSRMAGTRPDRDWKWEWITP